MVRNGFRPSTVFARNSVVQWHPFPFLFGGCATKNCLPQKGFPFFSRVTEQQRKRTTSRQPRRPQHGSAFVETSPVHGGVNRCSTIDLVNSSLPEFMNLKLFGKTILNVKFGLFVGPSTQQVRQETIFPRAILQEKPKYPPHPGNQGFGPTSRFAGRLACGYFREPSKWWFSARFPLKTTNKRGTTSKTDEPAIWATWVVFLARG